MDKPKTLKEQMIKGDKRGLTEIYTMLLQMRGLVTEMAVEKVKMLEGLQERIEDLKDASDYMELNKLLEKELKELQKENQNHNQNQESRIDKIRNSLEEIKKKEYL